MHEGFSLKHLQAGAFKKGTPRELNRDPMYPYPQTWLGRGRARALWAQAKSEDMDIGSLLARFGSLSWILFGAHLGSLLGLRQPHLVGLRPP